MFGAYTETECLFGRGEIKIRKENWKQTAKKLGLEDQLSACLWSIFLTDFHTSPDNFKQNYKICQSFKKNKQTKKKAVTSGSWVNFMSQILEIFDNLKQTGWKCFDFRLTTWRWGFRRSVCRLDLHFKALLLGCLQLFPWIDASENMLGSLHSPFWNCFLEPAAEHAAHTLAF